MTSFLIANRLARLTVEELVYNGVIRDKQHGREALRCNFYAELHLIKQFNEKLTNLLTLNNIQTC
jgi:hypothetical protein